MSINRKSHPFYGGVSEGVDTTLIHQYQSFGIESFDDEDLARFFAKSLNQKEGRIEIFNQILMRETSLDIMRSILGYIINDLTGCSKKSDVRLTMIVDIADVIVGNTPEFMDFKSHVSLAQKCLSE